MRILMASVVLSAAASLLTGCGPTAKFVSLQPHPSTQTVTLAYPIHRPHEVTVLPHP